MDPRLLDYYNQELAHVREMGGEFALEYPKIASRLGIEGLEVADPYVERLLEGFAFVAARVHLRLDAEFPRFTQHLLEILYPHYLTPTPSCMIIEMQPDLADTSLVEGVTIAAGSSLRSVVPRGEQTACQFRTAHEVELWPIEIQQARFFSFAPDLPLGQLGLVSSARSGLRIRLRAHGGVNFKAIGCDELTFYLNGADDIVGPLYELIHGQLIGALVVSADSPAKVLASLGKNSVREVGFEDHQSLMPQDRRSLQGYRLLREYFAFPQRFRFFSATGLRKGFERCLANECELVLLFGRNDAALEGAVDASNLALYASPAVNAFPRRADRIHLGEAQFEHHLMIDRARPMDFEVYSVSSVRGLGESADDETEFLPFYGDRVHHDSTGSRGFYTISRQPRALSARQRRHGTRSGYVGSEVYLSLVDPREAPFPQAIKQLAVEVIATNRDLPLLLPIGNPNTIVLEDARPVRALRILKGPSRPRAGLTQGDHAWRLVSHLSLNYLSLIDSAGADHRAGGALRELLALYVDPEDPSLRKVVDSILNISAKPVVRRLPLPGPIAFGRGLAVELHLNESAFGGAGGFLLGSVLEKFLARHVSINSFTQTKLISETRGEVSRWPARSGTRIVA